MAGRFSWGQCWSFGGIFGGRGIADFRDTKRKVYFPKDVSILTQSLTAEYISLRHQTDEGTNSMDFRTPKDHADKYFGEQQRRHNLKRRVPPCGKRIQERPGKLLSLSSSFFFHQPQPCSVGKGITKRSPSISRTVQKHNWIVLVPLYGLKQP